MTKRYCLLFTAILMIAFTAVFALDVQAANFTVSTTADSGAGSLRQAILDAGATAIDDTITFEISSGGAGCTSGVCTITLTSGELTITAAATAGTLTLTNAGGTTGIAISGNNQSRVFFVNPGGNLTLNNLTVTGGNGTGITVSGNGGGIYVNGGTATIMNSTIANNTTTNIGGGIYSTANNNAVVNITNSTINNNTAGSVGGGVRNLGTTTITNSTISNNTTNSASGGGGISNTTGTTTVINSTISNNTANGTSGGGGIRNTQGTVNLQNTIVAANIGPSTAPDIAGTIISQGYNLIGNNSGGTITAMTGDQIGTSGAPIDPRLGPLANNGGPTQTRALQTNSPAIDRGNGTGGDQRGFTRPVDNPSITNATGGNGADIGAFEVQQAPTAANVTVSGRVTTASGRGIRNVTITMIDSNGNERTATSTAFGYYRFDDVVVGETVTLSAKARRFGFDQSTIVRTTNDSITNADFVSEQ